MAVLAPAMLEMACRAGGLENCVDTIRRAVDVFRRMELVFHAVHCQQVTRRDEATHIVKFSPA